MENRIQSLLVSLGICDANSIVEFYPRVRDRDDVKVMRCNKSGVIFLSRSDHVSDSHYENQENFSYWSSQNRKQALLNCYDDDFRRARQFEPLIRNKKWLDMGTGLGGLLESLAGKAAEASAVEPQSMVRDELIRCGYKVYSDIREAEDDHFDIITLFHVFEHLPDPHTTLDVIAQKLARGGMIIIEVPHANDFLITFLNSEPFKASTFWSEHLILHTRQSLEAFLRAAGYVNISIMGYQRYPLANHLYWLSRGKPGGHKEWSFLVNAELDNTYQNLLTQLDKTDTLIAIARK